MGVAEIGVKGPPCHIGASNPIPGFLPRSWGSGSYEMGQVEHERVGVTDVEAGGAGYRRRPGAWRTLTTFG